MDGRKEKITGIVIGKMTNELQEKYAGALARTLISEYGEEQCKIMLEELKRSNKNSL